MKKKAILRSVTGAVFGLAASVAVHAASYVYVSNADSQDISVFRLDAQNGALAAVETVPVGGTVMPMAFSPDHHHLYAALRSKPYRVVSFAVNPLDGRLVELGRALCLEPSVLLLDEPASGLDDDETDELRVVVRGLADGGPALLLVEHDLSFVRDTANVVHAMAAGRVVASGPPAAIEADVTVRSIEGEEP